MLPVGPQHIGPDDFLLLCMEDSLKRKLRSGDEPSAKRLVIDYSPSRYCTPTYIRLVKMRDEAKNKSDLSARALQAWWRRAKCLTNVVNNTDPDLPRRGNFCLGGQAVVCPITQDAVEVSAVFRFVTGNGSVVIYSCPDLVAYLQATSNFVCALTREPFTLPIVRRLQRKAAGMGLLGWHSLLETFTDRSRQMGVQAEYHNRLLAIESSCADSMIHALDTCADVSESSERVSAELQSEALPEWSYLVREYVFIDAAACKTMLVADRVKLDRLSTNAAADPHGLLFLIQDAVAFELRACERAIESGVAMRGPRLGFSPLSVAMSSTSDPDPDLEALVANILSGAVADIAPNARPTVQQRAGRVDAQPDRVVLAGVLPALRPRFASLFPSDPFAAAVGREGGVSRWNDMENES